jgi:hypothetical protein
VESVEHAGKDTPQEIKKKDFGRPRRKYVDFLLLIGALRLRVLHTHVTAWCQPWTR